MASDGENRQPVDGVDPYPSQLLTIPGFMDAIKLLGSPNWSTMRQYLMTPHEDNGRTHAVLLPILGRPGVMSGIMETLTASMAMPTVGLPVIDDSDGESRDQGESEDDEDYRSDEEEPEEEEIDEDTRKALALSMQTQPVAIPAQPSSANGQDVSMPTVEDGGEGAAPAALSTDDLIKLNREFMMTCFHLEADCALDWLNPAAPTLPPNPNAPDDPEYAPYDAFKADFVQLLPLITEHKSIDSYNKACETYSKANRDATKAARVLVHIPWLLSVYRAKEFRRKAPITFLSFCHSGFAMLVKWLLTNQGGLGATIQMAPAEKEIRMRNLGNLLAVLQMCQVVAIELLEEVSLETHGSGLFDVLEFTLSNEASYSSVLKGWHRELKKFTLDQLRDTLINPPDFMPYTLESQQHHLYEAAVGVHKERAKVREHDLERLRVFKARQAKLLESSSGQKLATTPTRRDGRRISVEASASDPIVLDDSDEEDRKTDNVLRLKVPPQPAPDDDSECEMVDATNDEVQEITQQRAKDTTQAPKIVPYNEAGVVDEPDDENSSVGGRADDGSPVGDGLVDETDAQRMEDIVRKTNIFAPSVPAPPPAPAVNSIPVSSSETEDEDEDGLEPIPPPNTDEDEFEIYYSEVAKIVHSTKQTQLFAMLTTHFLAINGPMRLHNLIAAPKIPPPMPVSTPSPSPTYNVPMMDIDTTAAPATSPSLSLTPMAAASPSPAPAVASPSSSSTKSASSTPDYPPIIHTAFGAFPSHQQKHFPSLMLVRRSIFLLDIIRQFIPRGYMAHQFLQPLFITIMPRIQYLTESQLRTESTQNLVTTLSHIVDLWEWTYFYTQNDQDEIPNDCSKELLEKFEVEFAVRLLRSTYLEKRLLGLRWLTRFVDTSPVAKLGLDSSMEERIKASYQPINQPDQILVQRRPSIIIFDSTAAELFVQHELIQILFGEQLHIQLLKRATDIMKCIASTDNLQKSHIDTIWLATRGSGKHESVIQSVYSILIDIAYLLKPKPAVYLYRCIYSVPFVDYDARFIRMISSTTRNIMGNWTADLHWAHTHTQCNWETMLGLWDERQTEKKDVLNKKKVDPSYECIQATMPPRGIVPDLLKEDHALKSNPLILTPSSLPPCQPWDDFPEGSNVPFDPQTLSEYNTPETRARVIPSEFEYFGIDLLWHGFNRDGSLPPLKSGSSDGSIRSPRPSLDDSAATTALLAPLRDDCFQGVYDNILSPFFEESRPSCARRVEFMMLAFKNIRGHRNVYHSVKLFKGCLHSFCFPSPSDKLKLDSPKVGSNWDDRPTVMNWLETTKNITKIAFDDLAHFSRLVTQRIQAGANWVDDPYSLVFWMGPVSQLARRLELITFIFTYRLKYHEQAAIDNEMDTTDGGAPVPAPSPIQVIQFDHIDSLFRLFLLPTVMTNELRSLVYANLNLWLHQDLISIDLLQRIFNELIPQLNFSTIMKVGVDFVSQCFNLINLHLGRIELQDSIKKPTPTTRNAAAAAAAASRIVAPFVVRQYPVAGLEYFWRGAMCARDREVSDTCMNMIVRIYKSVPGGARVELNQRYEECVARVMHHIHSCTIRIQTPESVPSTDLPVGSPSGSAIKTPRELVGDLERGFRLLNIILRDFNGTKSISHEAAMKAASAPPPPTTPPSPAKALTPCGGSSKSASGGSILIRLRHQQFPELCTRPDRTLKIGELLVWIKHAIGHPKIDVDHIILLYNGQKLTREDQHKTLIDLKVVNEQVFTYLIPSLNTMIDGEDFRRIEEKLTRLHDIWVSKLEGEARKQEANTALASSFVTAENVTTETSNVTTTNTSVSLQTDVTESKQTEEKRQESKHASGEMQVDSIDATTTLPSESAPPASAAAAPVVLVHPSEILSRPEYFNQLFDLLSITLPSSSSESGSSASGRTTHLAEQCWRLLMQLPTNAQMLQRLKQLTSVPITSQSTTIGSDQHTTVQWDVLLPSQNLHKLHYSLQIVFAILPHHRTLVNSRAPVTAAADGHTDVDDSRWDGDRWERNFVARGGLRHLVKILVETDFSALPQTNALAPTPMISPTPSMNTSNTSSFTSSSHTQQTLDCLALLLKIVLRFIMAKSAGAMTVGGVVTPPATPILKPTPIRTNSSTAAPSSVLADETSTSSIPPSADGSVLKKRKLDESTVSNSEFVATAPKSKKRAIQHIEPELVQSELDSVFTFEVVHKLFMIWQDVSTKPDPFDSTFVPFPSAATSATAAGAITDASDPIIGPKAPPNFIATASFNTATQTDILNETVSDSLLAMSCILLSYTCAPIVKRFFFAQPSITRRWLHTLLASPRRSSRDQGHSHLLAISHHWSIIANSPLPHLSRHIFHACLHMMLSGEHDDVIAQKRLNSHTFYNIAIGLLPDLRDELVASTKKYEQMDEDEQQVTIQSGSIQRLAQSNESSSQSLQLDALQLIYLVFRRLKSYHVTEQFGDVVYDDSFVGYVKLFESLVDMIKKANEDQIESAANVTLQMDTNMTDVEESKQGAPTTALIPIVAPAHLPTRSPLSSLIERQMMIKFLYNDCLFDVPAVESPLDVPKASAAPRCKHVHTRGVTLSLMRSLASTSWTNFIALQRFTIAHQQVTSKDTIGYNYQPELAKRHVPYVGLVNQGATCYMNSLVQQLFMVPEFRFGVLAQLSTDVIEDEMKRADSLMYQMQTIFGNLQDSDRGAFDAQGFCAAYKDWEGNSMAKHIQMDVNEFFNVLFDRLEQGLKGSPHAGLLDECFGGKLSNQLIGCEATCQHKRERPENFYILSLDVKNKKNVQESLKSFVEGEKLEGDNKFMCSECNRKVDTHKRSVIQSTPKNLILHLKRFEFDFDTMVKLKLNDLFEFPELLDIYEYTNEGLTAIATAKEEQTRDPPSDKKTSDVPGGAASASVSTTTGEVASDVAPASIATSAGPASSVPQSALPSVDRRAYQYELTGVIVHTGSSQSGHYYSYALERCPLPRADHLRTIPQWYEFNDSRVTPFDVKTLPEQTFGGRVGDEVNGIFRPFSAYMLFYQKVEMHHQPHTNSVPAIPRHLPNNDPAVEVTPSSSTNQPSAKDAFMPLARTAGLSVENVSERADTEMTEANTHTAHKRKSMEPELGTTISSVPSDELQLDLNRRRCAEYRLQVANGPVSDLKRCLTVEEQSSLLPPYLFGQIWEDNVNLTADAYLFDANNLAFVWSNSVVGHYDFTGDLRDIHWNSESEFIISQQHSIQLACRFICETLVHAKQRGVVPWEADLKRMLTGNVPASRFFLDQLTKNPHLVQTGMHHGMVNWKKAWCACILAAIETVRPLEKSAYRRTIPASTSVHTSPIPRSNEKDSTEHVTKRRRTERHDVLYDPDESKEDEKEKANINKAGDIEMRDVEEKVSDDAMLVPATTIGRFISSLMRIDLKFLLDNWSKANFYWQLLLDFSLLGDEEIRYLMSEYPIGLTISQFLMGTDNLILPPGDFPNLVQARSKKRNISIKPMILLLSRIVQLASPRGEIDERMIVNGSDTINSITCHEFFEFICRYYDDPDLIEPIQIMIERLFVDDDNQTISIIRFLTKEHQSQREHELRYSLRYMEALMNISDVYRRKRIGLILKPWLKNLMTMGPVATPTEDGKSPYPAETQLDLEWATAIMKVGDFVSSEMKHYLAQTGKKSLRTIVNWLWAQELNVRQATLDFLRAFVHEPLPERTARLSRVTRCTKRQLHRQAVGIELEESSDEEENTYVNNDGVEVKYEYPITRRDVILDYTLQSLVESARVSGSSVPSGTLGRLMHISWLMREIMWTVEDKSMLFDDAIIPTIVTILVQFEKWMDHTDWMRYHIICLIEHCVYENRSDFDPADLPNICENEWNMTLRAFARKLTQTELVAFNAMPIGSTHLDQTKLIESSFQRIANSHPFIRVLTNIPIRLHKGSNPPCNAVYHEEVLGRAWSIANLTTYIDTNLCRIIAENPAFRWSINHLVIKEHRLHPRLERWCSDADGIFHRLCDYEPAVFALQTGSPSVPFRQFAHDFLFIHADWGLSFTADVGYLDILIKYLRFTLRTPADRQHFLSSNRCLSLLASWLKGAAKRTLTPPPSAHQLELIIDLLHYLLAHDWIGAARDRLAASRTGHVLPSPTPDWFTNLMQSGPATNILIEFLVHAWNWWDMEEEEEQSTPTNTTTVALTPASTKPNLSSVVAAAAKATAAGAPAAAAPPAPPSSASSNELVYPLPGSPSRSRLLRLSSATRIQLSDISLVLEASHPEATRAMLERLYTTRLQIWTRDQEEKRNIGNVARYADVSGVEYYTHVVELCEVLLPHAVSTPSIPTLTGISHLCTLTLLEYDHPSVRVSDLESRLCSILSGVSDVHPPSVCHPAMVLLALNAFTRLPHILLQLVHVFGISATQAAKTNNSELQFTDSQMLNLQSTLIERFTSLPSTTPLDSPTLLGPFLGTGFLLLQTKHRYLTERAAYDAGTSEYDSHLDEQLNQWREWIQSSTGQRFIQTIDAILAQADLPNTRPKMIEFVRRLQTDAVDIPITTPRTPRIAPSTENVEMASPTATNAISSDVTPMTLDTETNAASAAAHAEATSPVDENATQPMADD